MRILSPIPTYIINTVFAHFKLNKNHEDTIPYTDLYYQYSFCTFSVYQPRLILSIGFLHILMYPRYREIPFMT